MNSLKLLCCMTCEHEQDGQCDIQGQLKDLLGVCTNYVRDCDKIGFVINTDVLIGIPTECHECPFQLKFKDDTQDDWYMRRCVLANRVIEYPKPKWCPIKYEILTNN